MSETTVAEMIAALRERGHDGGFIAAQLGCSRRTLDALARGEVAAAASTLTRLRYLIDTKHLPDPPVRRRRAENRRRSERWF